MYTELSEAPSTPPAYRRSYEVVVDIFSLKRADLLLRMAFTLSIQLLEAQCLHLA